MVTAGAREDSSAPGPTGASALPPCGEVFDRMLASAKKLDIGKVKADQVATAGGVPDE